MSNIIQSDKKYSITLEMYCILFMLYDLLAFNYTFFEKIYQLSNATYTFVAFILLWALGIIACLILFHKHTIKPLSYLFLLINSSVFYFVKTYHVSIDDEMLQNALQTNMAETMDLLNLTWLSYVILLGLIPSFFISKLKIENKYGWGKKIGMIIVLLGCIAAFIIPNFQTIAPFVRTHKHTKYLLIPVNYIGAISTSIKKYYRQNHKFISIGADSHFEKYWQNDKKMLLILIIGETARADKFSLNGYERNTNEPLKPYFNDIINYPNVTSCGTSTAVSLPCIFSKDDRKNYDGGMAYTENLLDILQKNNYQVTWVENNSDCKNICNRVNTLYPCGIHPQEQECTDKVLIPEITKSLPQNPQNTMIILHQVGSHGPKYYKRYPQEFAKYLPVCNTEKLNECTLEELRNSYDNTIYYTSQNIAEIIDNAQKYKKDYNIVVIYASDHGESLGENNLYLHSAPYAIAPKEQTQIPFFIWVTEDTLRDLNLDKDCLTKDTNKQISHDYIFHTVLGLSGISTKEYIQSLDLLKKCKN